MNSSNNNDSRHPLFVKVFQPNHSSQSLLIPAEFKYKISGEIPNRVFLKNGAGKSWLVEVKTVGKKSYFQGGWSKFVLGNSLSFGEFMVFKYNGQRIFDVIILGINGCDKELVTRTSGKKLAQREAEEEDEANDGNGVCDDDEVMGNMKPSQKQNSQIEINSKNEGDDEDNDESDEEQEEDEDDDEDFSPKEHRRMLPKKNARENLLDRVEQHKDFEKYLPTKNPYFITQLRQHDLDSNRLLIPKSASIDDSKIDYNIVLQDPKGMNWDAKKSSWKTKQVWILGGWRELCNSNNVEEDDIVICELLFRSNEMCDCIKIHIIKPS